MFSKDLVPFGVADIVKGYNEFRARIVLLQELKHSLHSAEFELESLRTRYNALTGKVYLLFVFDLKLNFTHS